ncbi:CHAD domain-containing protein [Paenibacillus sophorae]|uniref:CHAD domain-containing protein n=1 Tax=Paenibacillus sophorae TaxID=1333845 RepID=A0A1H8SDU6_9BACL|nr:CHAD domain-containing protein [Paenibacillus sophorae]QWU16753.1 CHAD domain-containing protein [Paenibacillus sophorae]SEO76900.1 CHAD domain-containing protein [Paenibacillus sophorae]
MTTDTATHSSEISGAKQWEQAMAELYTSFLDHGTEALKDFDDEAVHQARVSSRKLLTLLAVLDPGHTSGLYAIFKQAQKRLGKVRDADVLIQSFKERRKAAKLGGDKKTAKLLGAVIRHQKAKRKRQRAKLADELPALMNGELQGKWDEFINERLPALVTDIDVNIAMRELEAAFEQQKKRCKEMFKQEVPGSRKALDELHKLRISAKRIRYTANAAAFTLDQKFHANEAMYKDIQSELGDITDKRVWLDTMEDIGRKELDASRGAWNAFMECLQTELADALRRNTVVDVPDAM